MFVRWDELKVENEEERQLPGYRDGAVVRRFDAPEALDTRFYEVRAKSALNRVPDQSQVPFRWTINPYRGCSHACVYCLGGETPILMADGRTKPLADVRIGDRIYGTQRDGYYRRYVETEVLAHWSTVKPAFRVTLQDGTELVASGDHRFLTGRGWKHVTGAMGGPGQRPYLTTNDELRGFGRTINSIAACADHRRGYLTGMVRGDANLKVYRYQRAGRVHGDVHRFRLALADVEGLQRTHDYLAQEGVATDWFDFLPATDARRAMTAIRTSSAASVARIQALVEWPDQPSAAWQRGFLAGI